MVPHHNFYRSFTNNTMDDVDDTLVKKAIAFVLLFGVVVTVNYTWGVISTKSLQLSSVYLSPYPSIVMNNFRHSNGTLLSPEGQDVRWNDYKAYYSAYQARLSRTSFEHYVIYYSTLSGLANKINGLVSCLLIAMVTDRGLKRYCLSSGRCVVADWPSFDSYFDLPLENHHVNLTCTNMSFSSF